MFHTLTFANPLIHIYIKKSKYFFSKFYFIRGFFILLSFDIHIKLIIINSGQQFQHLQFNKKSFATYNAKP